jgi:hypothetical protein
VRPAFDGASFSDIYSKVQQVIQVKAFCKCEHSFNVGWDHQSDTEFPVISRFEFSGVTTREGTGDVSH